MNQHDKENCINQVLGYYISPSLSDLAQSTVESRFESAKQLVIQALERNIENIKELSIKDVFRKYKSDTGGSAR